jgi:hypothetical protein
MKEMFEPSRQIIAIDWPIESGFEDLLGGIRVWALSHRIEGIELP